MHIYLVRHGEYNDSNIDPEKGLSEKGKQQVQTAADFIARIEYPPVEVWHSDKKRSQQTAEIIAETIQIPTLEKPYLSPASQIDEIVKDLELATENIVISGHLPFFNNLVSYLLSDHQRPEFIDFGVAGVLILTKPQKDWQLQVFFNPNHS